MTFKVQSEQTVRDLDKVKTDAVAAVRQVLGQLAALAAAHARATTAFTDRSGNLRGSIERGQKSTWAHFVKVGGRKARYAHYIESGSEPHEIKARRAKFLRFEQGGRVVFKKRVYHPGTKPARFMESARNVAEAVAAQHFESSLNAVISR